MALPFPSPRVLLRRTARYLDRPGYRGILMVAASLAKSVMCGSFCRVYYADGRWIHNHRDGVLVEREIRIASISRLNSMTRDHWFHQYTPKQGDTIIDVGAGTGWETLLCSELVGHTGRIIAIEAHPETYACLAEMVRRNNLPNVTPVWCAVSDTPGIVLISDDTHHQGNSIVVDNRNGFEVPALTLEELCKAEGVQEIDLLKMNIEGAEKYAIPSLGRMAYYTRHVAISCHDFLADWKQGDHYRSLMQVVDWLKRAGFSVYSRIDDPRPWVRDYVYGSRAIPMEEARAATTTLESNSPRPEVPDEARSLPPTLAETRLPGGRSKLS